MRTLLSNAIKFYGRLLVFALLLAACSPNLPFFRQPTPTPAPTATPTPIPTPTAPPQPASLSGRILDRTNGQSIEEAEVSTAGQSTTTDPDGRYAFELSPGQYVLSITHDAYDPGLSAILTLQGGQSLVFDVPLYPPGQTPYPQDPLRTGPFEPEGAPTPQIAERLARLQGLLAEVVEVTETSLSGLFLVNYRAGDEVRAAVVEIDQPAWQLTDNTGQSWLILHLNGSLVRPVEPAVSLPTPAPSSLPLAAEVILSRAAVRSCPMESCAEVGSLLQGMRAELMGCLADGSWCQVGLRASDETGWTPGVALRPLVVSEAVPVVLAN